MEETHQPVQLNFKAFDLADHVARVIAIEAEKKEINDDFNMRIKALKKRIARLSAEIESERKRVS